MRTALFLVVDSLGQVAMDGPLRRWGISAMWNSGEWADALQPVIQGVPTLVAAALAWFLPSRATRPAPGPRPPARRWWWLCACGLVTVLLLALARALIVDGGGVDSVGSGLADALPSIVIGLPYALLSAWVVLGVLQPIWRAVMTPVAAGFVAGLAFALPIMFTVTPSPRLQLSLPAAGRNDGLDLLTVLPNVLLSAVIWAVLAGLLNGSTLRARVLSGAFILTLASGAGSLGRSMVDGSYSPRGQLVGASAPTSTLACSSPSLRCAR